MAWLCYYKFPGLLVVKLIPMQCAAHSQIKSDSFT